MRLPESKIKAAILDPDLEIRQRAISYFARSFSSDSSIMPLVIKAVETYGRQDAFCLIGFARDLPQNEDTIAWVIDELNDERSSEFENYTYNLSVALVGADPSLLLPIESSVLEARYFFTELQELLVERLRMLAWDEATCWQSLEAFCEEGKGKQYTNEVNLGYANRIIEALARYGEECEPKVQSVLRQKVDDYRHHPMKWMEPLAVRLAGQAHLDSTIPLIVSKLLEDGGDLLNSECAEALTRIGTADVLQAVAEVYPEGPHHFRLYATAPLEHIHSDLAVEMCLHLLRQELEDDIRLHLAQALLTQFADEGIDEARRLLLGRELDFESTGLRNYLLETCTIMGRQFPEYDEWQAAEKAEKEEHWKRVKELEGSPEGMLLFALQKLIGKKDQEVPKEPPLGPSVPSLNSAANAATRQKVGRNDPCPCGSGKKFKKCCLRDQFS